MTAGSEWVKRSSTAKEHLKEHDTVSMTSEMSTMSFEFAGHSVDQSISVDRKVIGYKTRTVSEPIYEDELVKNLTMEICYEVTNTSTNSIYIPINVYLKGYNR